MAQSAKGNVLPLGNHPRAKPRFTSQESADLLTGCRELAMTRMSLALASMLDRLEDDLFEMAEQATDREAQDVYLDARSHARAGRQGMEVTFRRHFLDLFNRRMKGGAARAPTAAAPAWGEFSLVADEDLEEALAVSAMSRKLEAACEGELFALSQRVGYLLERPELEDAANPMSPEAICAALRGACDHLQAGFKVRMTLLRQFERYAETELQRVYHDLNSHLAERRVLPDVRPTPRRAAAPQRPVRVEAPKPAPGGDLFATLAQLLGTAAAAGGAPASGTAGAEFHPGVGAPAGTPGPAVAGAGAVTALAAPNAAAAPFLESLTRMHRESAMASLASDASRVNVVKGLRDRPDAAALGALDAMTIDLVAMLFDYIFEDDGVPASVKALLGRLQIPLLKVALLDKAFFSSRAHPARHLLDGLAESALGLDEDDILGVETLAMIDGVVDRVLAEFDSDLALFVALGAEVDAFLARRGRDEEDIVQRSASLIEAREKREIALAIAQSEVARRLEMRAWVPPVVRDMLLGSWSQALANVVLGEGEGSEPWKRLTVAIDDLLWSVEPKEAPNDRKRLLAMLPAMIQELHHGMHRGGAEDAERNAFLNALVDCHAMAVKAGLRGMAAMPQPPVLRVAPTASIEREIVPAGDLQVEEIRLRTAPGEGAVRNVFTRTGIWTNLQRGTWVEFARASGTPVRTRLTWISPNKGVYLFTNPLSATSTAVSISPEALAEQMRLGEARLLDAGPLVERAVDSMLATLRDKKAGARSPSP